MIVIQLFLVRILSITIALSLTTVINELVKVSGIFVIWLWGVIHCNVVVMVMMNIIVVAVATLFVTFHSISF